MTKGSIILILPPGAKTEELRAQVVAAGYQVRGSFVRPTLALEHYDRGNGHGACPDLILVDWDLAESAEERNALRLLSLWHDFALLFLVDRYRLPPPDGVLNGKPFFQLVKPFDLLQAQAMMDAAMYQRQLEEDLRANQAELQTMNHELENHVNRLLRTRHLEVLGRMTGGILHDFNSLLMVIRNQGEMLVAEHPDLREGFAVIEEARKNAARLIERLRAFSQKQTLVPVAIDPSEMVTGLGGILRGLVGVRIQLQIEATPGGSMVLVDSVQLQQAVMNLVANARDAIPENGHIMVRVFEEAADAPEHVGDSRLDPLHRCVIEVRDDGSGMDEETQQHLFEPFFSTKGEKGTGLGLSTVYGFVKQSGGYIEVESQKGKGTKFRITLPVMKKKEG